MPDIRLMPNMLWRGWPDCYHLFKMTFCMLQVVWGILRIYGRVYAQNVRMLPPFGAGVEFLKLLLVIRFLCV